MEKNLIPIAKSNFLSGGENWAVIVGISNYKDSTLNLQFAHRDAEEIYTILTKSNFGIFKEDHIMKLINEKASYANIIAALRDFLQKPALDDLVLLYFSCHGGFDPNRPKNSYILPYDTNPKSIASTAIPMREIEESINDTLNSKKIIIIADACHSAAIGGDMTRRNINSTPIINKFLQEMANSREGTALFTSAETEEVAFEDAKWGGGHGVFTHYLLEGLRGAADGYGGGRKDGIISIGELFEYVRDNVKLDTDHRQHPLIGSSSYDRNLPLSIVSFILDNSALLSNSVNSGTYVQKERLEYILNILQNSQVNDFNNLRKNDNQPIYLQNIDLSDKNLSGIDLHEAILSQAVFRKTKMNFANLTGTKLTKADLTEVDLSSSILDATIFKEAKLIRADLRESELKGMVDFSGADLSHADLREVNFKGMVSFQGAILHNVDFTGSYIDMRWVNIDSADIRNVKGLPSTLEPSNKYSSALKQFSENISDLFNRANVSVDNKKIIEETMKQLIKDVDSIKSFGDLQQSEKTNLQIKFEDLIKLILKILPSDMQIIKAIVNPLSKFNELMDKTILDIIVLEMERKRSTSEADNVNKWNNGSRSLYKLDKYDLKLRNLYFDNLAKLVSDQQSGGSDGDFSGKVILASNGSDVVLREKIYCKHNENDSSHPHGAFSFHLIEGLKGGADLANNGLVTLENLRQYIEIQMLNENKQKPFYAVSNVSKIENINVAIIQNKFEQKIKKLIEQTDDILSRKKSPANFSNVFDLQDAANKIKELIELDSENKEIPRLQSIIDNELNLYKDPTIKWINSNMRFAIRKVNEIRNQLFEEELPDLVNRLCFSELLKIPDSYFVALVYLFAEVEKNTKFESFDDPTLNAFVAKLRVAIKHDVTPIHSQENYNDGRQGIIQSFSQNYRRQAIIIGISEYEASERFPTLNGAENDAKEIRDILTNAGNAGKFEIHGNHYMLGNKANRKNILRAFSKVFRENNEYDFNLVYFSGHSYVDENGEVYLAPYDMDLVDPIISGINIRDLKNTIQYSRNTNVIFIFDCCYAGVVSKDIE